VPSPGRAQAQTEGQWGTQTDKIFDDENRLFMTANSVNFEGFKGNNAWICGEKSPISDDINDHVLLFL